MLEELKLYLNITWSDNEIDEKLKALIIQSKTAINNLMGIAVNYEEQADMKELLFNRIRYAYSNSLEYFEENYRAEILRLQLLTGVKQDNE